MTNGMTLVPCEQRYHEADVEVHALDNHRWAASNELMMSIEACRRDAQPPSEEEIASTSTTL